MYKLGVSIAVYIFGEIRVKCRIICPYVDMDLEDIYAHNNDHSMNPLNEDVTRKDRRMSAMETSRSEDVELASDPGVMAYIKPVQEAFVTYLEGDITYGEPVKSFYPLPNKKIITYRPEGIKSFLVPFFQHDLSACYSFWVWAKHLGIVGYAISLSFILAYCYYPDGEIGSGPACVGANNRNMCTLEKTLGDAKLEFRFLIAFILAGFVANSVANWNQRRSTYASLCGNVRNCLVTVNAIISKNNDPRNARNHCSRWILLVFEFSVLKARGHMDSDEGKEHLERLGLLQPGEWNCMAPGDRHTTVIFWLNSMIVEYQREGLIHSDHSQKTQLDFTALRSYANDLMSNINIDEPISYSALTGLLVKTNVFIFSTWKAVEWSAWIFAFTPSVLFNDQSRMMVDIAVLLAWNISYTALYDLGYMLNNPFGNRRIDLPHESIGANLRKFANALNSDGVSLPPAFR